MTINLGEGVGAAGGGTTIINNVSAPDREDTTLYVFADTANRDTLLAPKLVTNMRCMLTDGTQFIYTGTWGTPATDIRAGIMDVITNLTIDQTFSDLIVAQGMETAFIREFL